ncbi:hypothetical protein [Flavobacterium sp. HNIBRBA15423]|uniref:hypothetical protein n=1 Tax=Flavobacterium sp. HNIBRBA15423 TaxID=3458683 RepID=UPI00404500DC
MKLNKKNKILLIAIIISLILTYKLAIVNTIHYHSLLNTLNKQLENSLEQHNASNTLVIKNKRLDVILEKLNYSSEIKNQQNNLLKVINENAEKYNLIVVAFEEPKTIVEANNKITHYYFRVIGEYNKTLLLLNYLENNAIFGKIKHFNTVKKTNYKENRKFITTEIILEKKTYLDNKN